MAQRNPESPGHRIKTVCKSCGATLTVRKKHLKPNGNYCGICTKKGLNENRGASGEKNGMFGKTGDRNPNFKNRSNEEKLAMRKIRTKRTNEKRKKYGRHDYKKIPEHIKKENQRKSKIGEKNPNFGKNFQIIP